MANNVTLNSMSGGSVVATEDIGGVHFQKVKIVTGAAGVDGGPITVSNPVPTTYRARTTDAVSANLSTDVVMQSGNVPLAVRYAPVNVGTNGQILISGVANKKLRVLNGFLLSSAAATISIKSNNNAAAGGPLPLIANEGFIIPYAPSGNFETIAGQNLTISFSAAATVGGWLAYVEV